MWLRTCVEWFRFSLFVVPDISFETKFMVVFVFVVALPFMAMYLQHAAKNGHNFLEVPDLSQGHTFSGDGSSNMLNGEESDNASVVEFLLGLVS